METSIWNVVLTAFKVDVILFVADEECMNRLHSYAETRFHGLNDDYRRYIATIESEKIRKEYDSIVSDGDPVSKHNFRLPETIQVLMRLVVRNTEIIFLSVKRLELQS
jgi:type III restriction enzyme